MRRRRLGRSGLVVSEICLGTMTFGSMADERTSHAILDRAFDAGIDFVDVAEVCRREHVHLLPYSPIGGGVLSGKYQNGARPARSRFSLYGEHSPRTQAMTRRFVNEKTLATTARMMAIAEQAGLSPVTLAVAWTLAHDFVGSTIIGATTPEHLADALAAAEVHLSPDVLAACDAVGRDIPYPMG